MGELSDKVRSDAAAWADVPRTTTYRGSDFGYRVLKTCEYATKLTLGGASVFFGTGAMASIPEAFHAFAQGEYPLVVGKTIDILMMLGVAGLFGFGAWQTPGFTRERSTRDGYSSLDSRI